MLSTLIRYFDLQSGQRNFKSTPLFSPDLLLGDVKKYSVFKLDTPVPGLKGKRESLSPDKRIVPDEPIPPGQSGVARHAPVIPQYLAVSAGVILEPFLRHYIDTNSWNIDLPALWGRVVFGLIISIIILPGIYKSSFDPKQPVLIQIAALMPLGIGWQSIFMSATQAVTG